MADEDANLPNTPITVIPAPEPQDRPEPISTREAAQALAAARHRHKEPPAAPPEAAAEPEPPPEKVEDSAPEEVRAEETEVDDQAQPPVEPPRSWSREDKEIFRSLPRETQERVADRERSREKDFLTRQQEATEKLKGLSTREQEVENARQQYETALPILLQNLQSGMAGEFADIKNMSDVQKMANDDWPRYIRWDAAQKQVAAVQQEVQAAQQRQVREQDERWTSFAEEQDTLLTEKAPDFADKARAQALREKAVDYLKDIGFTQKELSSAWSGKSNIPFRDHRVQLLILDGIKFRERQEQAKTVTAKPLPPVQRPGVSQPKGAAQSAQMETLGKKIDIARSSQQGIRAAADFVVAQRAAAARRAWST